MNKLLKALLIVAGAMIGVQNSAHAGYSYVGSWIVGEGPEWTSNPTVFSGQSAAAFLFGGSSSDYAISTIDSNVANINHLTFLDGWGDDQYLFSPASEAFSVDSGPAGYNDPYGGPSYSAYVLDHSCSNRYSDLTAACDGDGVQYVNYAFRIDNSVPEPGSLVLMGLGLVGLTFMRRRVIRSS